MTGRYHGRRGLIIITREESDQRFVECGGMADVAAVWRASEHNQLGLCDRSVRPGTRAFEGNNAVAVAVDHQSRNGDELIEDDVAIAFQTGFHLPGSDIVEQAVRVVVGLSQVQRPTAPSAWVRTE